MDYLVSYSTYTPASKRVPHSRIASAKEVTYAKLSLILCVNPSVRLLNSLITRYAPSLVERNAQRVHTENSVEPIFPILRTLKASRSCVYTGIMTRIPQHTV